MSDTKKGRCVACGQVRQICSSLGECFSCMERHPQTAMMPVSPRPADQAERDCAASYELGHARGKAESPAFIQGIILGLVIGLAATLFGCWRRLD